MKKLIFTLLFCIPLAICSQNPSNLKEITKLYKQNENNEKRIAEILRTDPQLKTLLDSYMEKKLKENKGRVTDRLFNFDEENFKFEGEKIKNILSEKNLNKIKELFYSIQNSEYAKDISYIVLRQMEKAKDELEGAIKQFPKQ